MLNEGNWVLDCLFSGIDVVFGCWERRRSWKSGRLFTSARRRSSGWDMMSRYIVCSGS